MLSLSLGCFLTSVPSAWVLFVVQSLGSVLLFTTSWTAAHLSSLSFTVSQSLLKFMSFELVMLSNRLILCHPLLLLPSVFPSIRVFSNESALHVMWESIGASVSTLVLPVNIQGWLPLGLTGLISLPSKALSRIFSNTTVESINSSVLRLLYGSIITSVHDYWKNHSFDYMAKWCLCFLIHGLDLS